MSTTWLPTARDVERFWTHVVRGPEDRHCWFWTGAIADDGYGRFWVKIDGKDRSLRPHRFLYVAVTGKPLDPDAVIEHKTCDNPICVRFNSDDHDHLLLSDQSANLRRMAQRGRGGGDWLAYRFRGNDRASLAARSRRLRDAVKDGWDEQKILDAIGPQEHQAGLW